MQPDDFEAYFIKLQRKGGQSLQEWSALLVFHGLAHLFSARTTRWRAFAFATVNLRSCCPKCNWHTLAENPLSMQCSVPILSFGRLYSPGLAVACRLFQEVTASMVRCS